MALNLDMLPHAALTFAISGEDMALRKLLKKHVIAGHGTYVDIGCAAPDSASNTCLFYCLGWSGPCVDANPVAAPYWAAKRPKDKFVCAAVSDQAGEINLFRHKSNLGMHIVTHATIPPSQDFHDNPERIPIRRLDSLFAEHIGERPIQLLSMDIEGSELSALQSNDWDRWRPEVIIIE